jgi:P27 family predicted phage terminase small subunit
VSNAPKCPTDAPPEVQTEFARLVAILGDRLRPEDEFALLMFATAWATWRNAQADVARDGRVVMSGGTACPHPALSVAHQAHRELLQLAKELGLSPAQRKRLRIDKRPRPAKEDWLE